MNALIRKKIILHLLDCTPKSANEIAAEIDESLTSVEDQLTALVSENICKKVSRDEAIQYVVKNDIETFAQLVKEFLSEKKEHRAELFANIGEEISRFITSEYYFTRIDDQLVNYVLRRVHSDLVCQTDEKQEQIRRILLASPSGLFFVLHGDKAIFSKMYSSWNQLDPSDSNRDWITQQLLQKLLTLLLEMLIADVQTSAYISLYMKLQVKVVKINNQVELATPDEKYIELTEKGTFSFAKLEGDSPEGLRFGQSIKYVDPMDSCNLGLAFLHLGEFQAALKHFDDALDEAQNPTQKAIVLNNKGWAFLNLKQYQEAIECFEKGIEFDSEGEISELRENKQIAEEYLARATDADNLTEPTQIRFVQGEPIPFEETRFCEFKEIKGENPVNRIKKDSDEYAVAFLNREGGSIFWGIKDGDGITVGVTLNKQQKDKVRRVASGKLRSITPPISVEDWDLRFHKVYDLQGDIVEDLWVVELLLQLPRKREVFYTNSGKLLVKGEGVRDELLGPEATEFILRRLRDDTETE